MRLFDVSNTLALVVSASRSKGRPGNIVELTNVGPGIRIVTLDDPFAGMGLGLTTWETFGKRSPQLALFGATIVVGSEGFVAGIRYQIGVVAVSGDSRRRVSRVFSVMPLGDAGGDPPLPDSRAPVITSASVVMVDENAAVSLPLTADEDVLWTISGGADRALFALSGATLTMPPRDADNPTDANLNSVYLVEVTATDATGNISLQQIAVTVVNVNDTTASAFVLADANNVPTGTKAVSNTITVAGLGANDSAQAIVSGATSSQIAKNGGAWGSAPVTVANGDKLAVRHDTSISLATVTSTTLTIGTTSEAFTSTTTSTPAPMPLPAGVLVAIMADSIGERNHAPVPFAAGGDISMSMRGAMATAWQRDHRFRLYATYDANARDKRGGPNRSKTGDTTAQMLARMAEITALNAPAFYLAGGINDVRAGLSAQSIMDNLTAMIGQYRTARPDGRVLLNTIRASASATSGATLTITPEQQAVLLVANDLIRAYATANSSFVALVDVYHAYKQADGYADITKLSDGLHPNPKGTYAEVNGYLLSALRSLIQPGSVLEIGPNLFPFDFKTSGGTVANGVTGSPPAGTHATRSAASGSSTATITTDPVTGRVTLEITPGGTAIEQFRFGQNNTFVSIPIPDGSWVRLMMDVEVSGVDLNGVQLSMYLGGTTAGPQSTANQVSLVVGDAGQQSHGTYTLATEAIPAPAGTQVAFQYRLMVAADGNKSGAGTAKVIAGNPYFLVVPNPAA